MATRLSVTTSLETPLSVELDLRRQRGLWSDAWRRLLKNRLAMVGLVMLVVVAAVAFLAPHVHWIGHYAPGEQHFEAGDKQASPSWKYWFGTDQLGRDMWARTLEGLRISLQIGVGTQVLVLAIGVLVGASAALGGRLTDNILMRLTDVTYAFPDLLFIILIRAALTGSPDNPRDLPIVTNQKMVIIIAIAMVNWTTIARLVRGQMLSLAERDYVLAARALGASRWRIVMQHMLPNTLGPVIVAITFGIPVAIFAEAALSFIGFGVPPPAASLGTLVKSGYDFIQRNVWNVVFPAGAIALLMLCFTFLGDGLRDALDPRTR
ncbi:MAG TPA: ABC transporter permease [Dehalococcoidia bacterium]|jgi:oligopeptide transport system permease protein|nr:ABC transporter permease [Dehalococcoidia bacterium]